MERRQPAARRFKPPQFPQQKREEEAEERRGEEASEKRIEEKE